MRNFIQMKMKDLTQIRKDAKNDFSFAPLRLCVEFFKYSHDLAPFRI